MPMIGASVALVETGHLLPRPGPAFPYSIIAGDRTVVGRRTVAKVKHHLVDKTPSPAFGRVIAFDDRMARLVEMLCGMAVRRVVATADMAAGPAEAQMQPRRTDLQTFLATESARPYVADRFGMGAFGGHQGLPVVMESAGLSPVSERKACSEATTCAPSPTAAATRLTDPQRTSPIAKTPGRVVSSGLWMF